MAEKVIIRNLIVISDTHCGCRLGLYPTDYERSVDDGGVFKPSRFQRGVWDIWTEFWDVWVPEVTRGEPYDIVHNGDVIDGTHHHSTHQISHNIKDQKRIAVAALAPQISRAKALGGRYFHVRGTEAHVGQSGVYEEELAEELGATPNEEGQYARYELWKRVGIPSKRVPAPLVHLLHHIGTTGSAAHEASAVNAEYTASCNEAARWGYDPPDYVVRGHRHRYIGVRVGSSRGYAESLVVPGWQGKTPFTWKIPGARLAQPQFGGAVIRQGDEEFYCRTYVRTLKRGKEEN